MIIAALLTTLAAVTVKPTGFFERPSEPNGLSGITWAGDERFYSVCDEDGTIHLVDIKFDLEKGTIVSASLGAAIKGNGGKDYEGCAYDRLTGRLLVADETDSTVYEYDLSNGKRCRRIPVSDNVRINTRWNFSFESVTLSADGLSLYVANEEALKCDGNRSNASTGTVVRLMRFTRKDAKDAWRFDSQSGYLTDKWTEASNPTHLNCCGVSDLAALPDGSLIVLERELSGFTFRFRLYHINPAEAKWPAIVSKRLVYSYSERFSLFGGNRNLGNFEGIALGPELKDGSRVLVLVSDAGDKYMTKSLFMTFKINL